jgi:hypothetical protein
MQNLYLYALFHFSLLLLKLVLFVRLALSNQADEDLQQLLH